MTSSQQGKQGGNYGFHLEFRKLINRYSLQTRNEPAGAPLQARTYKSNLLLPVNNSEVENGRYLHELSPKPLLKDND